jgi:hypothetical protein
MRRFSLRTLIVVMLLGGLVCAWGWRRWEKSRKPEVIHWNPGQQTTIQNLSFDGCFRGTKD